MLEEESKTLGGKMLIGVGLLCILIIVALRCTGLGAVGPMLRRMFGGSQDRVPSPEVPSVVGVELAANFRCSIQLTDHGLADTEVTELSE